MMNEICKTCYWTFPPEVFVDKGDRSELNITWGCLVCLVGKDEADNIYNLVRKGILNLERR